jgi:hypothetical protein
MDQLAERANGGGHRGGRVRDHGGASMRIGRDRTQ